MLSQNFSTAEEASQKLHEIKSLMKNENMIIKGLTKSIVTKPQVSQISSINILETKKKPENNKLFLINMMVAVLIQTSICFYLIFYSKGMVKLIVTTECPVNTSRTYGESCNILPCKTGLDLVCQTGNETCNCPLQSKKLMCDCERTKNNEYYWNGSSCTTALEYNQACYNSSTSYMCQTLTQGTRCSASGVTTLNCKCSSTQYFNPTNNQCENVLSINDNCTQYDACNSNLGLACKNSLCQCNSLTQFWSIFNVSCINYLAYNTGVCTDDSQCSNDLICKTSGISCNCPENVGNGKCDCPQRQNGNEYYWDGLMCLPALEYNQACSASHVCQTITQGTICNGPPYQCTCQSDQYFNFGNNKCENFLSANQVCLQADSCNMKLNLICQNGSCTCASVNSCSKMVQYNNGPCTSDEDCFGNLICRTSGVSCNCPRSVLTSKCDCPSRFNGSEFYWDGFNCTTALEYNQNCKNSSTSYMCKIESQGTVCRGFPYQCKCNSSQFFNYPTSKCENLLLNNQTCQQNDSCNSALGLSCKNKLCACNISIQFWKPLVLSCVNYYTYTGGSCTANDQCLSNLICDTKTARCICSTNYFWDGYNCVTCPSGWIYQRGSCFFTTSYGKGKGPTHPESLSASTLISECNNQASARLAVIYITDFPIKSFLSGLTTNSDYWFDYFRTSNADKTYSSTNGTSTTSYSSKYWDSTWTNGYFCAKWIGLKDIFQSDDCSHNHNLICEIVPY